MALYKYLRQTWKKEGILRERLIQWRRDPSTIRLDHPTRLDRARSLGYRAKQGIFVVRQRVIRGGHTRPANRAGRTGKNMRRRMNLNMSYQWIAEQRAQTTYTNCEVLNSYFVAKDGQHYWYEIIMVDKNHPAILKDHQLGWIAQPQHTSRVFRGLTASGKRSRGILTNWGLGAEKIRPSIRANHSRAR